MSLMNDMLRDLEARDARPPVESVRHTATDRRRRWIVPAISGITLLATGLLAAWLIRDVPAVVGTAPDHAAPVGAVSDRDPTPKNIANRSSLPQRASAGVGAVSNRDQTQTRKQSPTDSAPTAAPVQPVGAVSDRDQTQTEHPSPTDSAPTANTMHPVGAVSDRDQTQTQTQNQSPTNSAPATRQSKTSIVVRPAGRTRDATVDDLDSARRALARGQTGVAITRLEQLLNSRPGLAEARILLARTLLASGRPQRAEALLSQGLETDPENHQLALWLARNRLEQQRPEAALETLQAQQPPVEEAPDFHLLLGATLRQLERHDAAFEAYQRITTAFPDNARAWLGQALSAEALGRPETAGAAYRHALEHGDARAAQLARQRLNALGRASQAND